MTQAAIRPGQKVVLSTDNPFLDGHVAEVSKVTEYGAVVLTGVGGGQYRALFEEMLPLREATPGKADSRDMGFTGDVCDKCGGANLKRNGACLLCTDCGETSGCS
jgi:hypothetical protein